jgi:hypothetical protein
MMLGNWHDRFKAMKSELGLTNSDIAKITENILIANL